MFMHGAEPEKVVGNIQRENKFCVLLSFNCRRSLRTVFFPAESNSLLLCVGRGIGRVMEYSPSILHQQRLERSISESHLKQVTVMNNYLHFRVWQF